MKKIWRWFNVGRFTMLDIFGCVFVGGFIVLRDYLGVLIILLLLVFIAGLRGKP